MGSTFETSYDFPHAVNWGGLCRVETSLPREVGAVLPRIVPLMLPLGQTRHFVSNPRETNHF